MWVQSKGRLYRVDDVSKKAEFLTYEDILKKKPKKKSKKLRGGQSVPMDLDKINASLEATQKPPKYEV